MLSNDVKNYIAGLADDKLVEYFQCGPDYYQSEALEFAAEEMRRRNISTEAATRGKAAAEARIQSDLAVEQEELSRSWKVLAFLSGLTAVAGIPTLVMLKSASFETHRRIRKRRELWQYFRYGLCCFLIVCTIYTIIRLFVGQLESY